MRRLTTTERGYGAQHKRERERWAAVVKRGEAYCTRCHGWIAPGSRWHLDHDDVDRTRYRGASHAYCNVAAGNRHRHRPMWVWDLNEAAARIARRRAVA